MGIKMLKSKRIAFRRATGIQKTEIGDCVVVDGIFVGGTKYEGEETCAMGSEIGSPRTLARMR